MAHMHKHRLLFTKTGRACYISHLDLMRTFPRAFLRAGLDVKQTQGFNQHSFVNIALPLSLGYSSVCEILEFELVSDVPLSEVPAKMNAVLPEGIEVLKCYESTVPLRHIAWIGWECRLSFDAGIPETAGEDFLKLFAGESLVIRKPSKKSRKGYVELDLIPLIHSLELRQEGNDLVVNAVLAAQNPGLNPELMIATAREQLDGFAPDFVEHHRRDIFSANFEIFR